MMRGNRNDRSVSNEDLSAFADGQLSRADSARVAAYLRANPQDADRIYAYWKQEAELHSVFATDREGEPEPAARNPRSPYRGPLFIAGAAALFAVVVPWLVLDRNGSTQGVVLPAPAETQQAGPSYAGLELEPGQHPMEEGMVEYHFSGGDGSSLVLYETAAQGVGAGYSGSQRGAARVEWVEGGRHFALEGGRGAAELMSLAVSLRRHLSSPPAVSSGSDMLAAPPADGPALQPIQEKDLPSGVSKM
ncbi:anti-sigma factor family protein [Microbulbifer halophilus]|uniref:Anti-sigma factor family protein n=1 Tax=Microbulbifer halophilus TaxID=453963 RepID=A0ABW5E6J1_9GAMM|nr:hypothetical protein [Microbulbifer halophilus]MCW8126881.1 hypothetical protein [Microbulbifer halophilus]